MALTDREARRRGVRPYQYCYVIDRYLGSDQAQGQQLFRRPDWRHFWQLREAYPIEPFALADVVAVAGPDGARIRDRCRGTNLRQTTALTIAAEDEPYFRALFRPVAGTPTFTERDHIEKVVARDIAQSIAVEPADLNLRKVRQLEAENRANPFDPPKASLAERRRRHQTFLERIKRALDYQCQVCGVRLTGPDGSASADAHHLDRWKGRQSDLSDNVLSVCPNCHRLFERSTLRFDRSHWTFERWDPAMQRYSPLSLAIQGLFPTVPK